MIITTTNGVADRKIVEVFGLVRGNTVRSRHVGRDIGAFFKNLVGGEIDDYTKLLGESREQALDRMIAEANAMGANAIVGLRFATSEIAAGASEFMAYGTAVRVE